MNRFAAQVFTLLMRKEHAGFIFPAGPLACRTVEECLQALQRQYITLGRERIVDFCICQVYALSSFGAEYLLRWRVSHSFGVKARKRYAAQTPVQEYFQDKWLRSHGLSRGGLRSLFADRSHHPLYKFLFPEYEERTKGRLCGTEAGFHVCRMSTLLWTPFSAVCSRCTFSSPCREITQRRYHELYRLRLEEFNEQTELGHE